MDVLKYINKMYTGSLNRILKNVHDKRYVIHARNKEESILILKIFKSAGIEVSYYIENKAYNDYKEEICYRIDFDSRCSYNYQICFGTRECYTRTEYVVLPIEYLIDNGTLK